MSKQGQEILFVRWADKVRERVGDHVFAAPQLGEGQSLLDRLLEAVYRKHFHSPLAWVEPPLQGFPQMPLDHRWVELQLRNENEASWLRQVRIDGETIGNFAATPSAHSLLSSADCYTILGSPGSGKSTILRWAAQYMIREPRLPSIIPLYIPLRSYLRLKDQHRPENFYAFFWSRFLNLPERLETEFLQFMEEIEGGTGERRNLCRVLLDGWDELPTDFQGMLLSNLERFENTFPAILTTRPIGFVSSLPPWPRFTILPLSFDAMRALMHEWYANIERGELENITCRHLDKYAGLRDLARNPFVLTLLCAVVGRRHKRLPTTRGELYRDALTLIAKYCEEHKHEHGMSFHRGVMRATERAAFELLRRSERTTYEFIADDVSQVADDEGDLFETWKAARLVTEANEFDGSFSFQHTTIHEYLAAQELCRRVSRREMRPEELGFDPTLLNLFTFAFGRIQPEGKRALWSWLKDSCAFPDRFGVIFIKAAQWLAEAGEQDGGQAKINVDVRERLWGLFVISPVPRRYAEALVALDVDWTIKSALCALQSDSPISLVHQTLLLWLIPTESQGWRELAWLWNQALSKQSTTLIELNDEQRLVQFGRERYEAARLTLAESSSSETELIDEAEKESKPPSLALLLRIAWFRGTRGEQFLVQRLKKTPISRQWLNIVDALGVLGTLGARDALLDAIEVAKAEPKHLVHVLRTLMKLPLDRFGDRLLALLDPRFPNPVRVAAAATLGNTESSTELNQLTDFARLSEPDKEVRKSAIAALARAKCLFLVRVLWDERTARTPREVDERVMCIDYLGAIAKHMSSIRDYGGYFPHVEDLLLDALKTPGSVKTIAIQRAAELRGSERLATALKAIARDLDSTQTDRAAAISSLFGMGQSLSTEEMIRWLNDETIKGKSSEIAPACADVLVHLSPEKLLDRKDRYSTTALWRLSLAADALVFQDRIVHPETTGQRIENVDDLAEHSAKDPQKVRPKKGRPSKDPIDPAFDQQVADAWATGEYKGYPDLGRAFKRTPEQIERLMNRVQKRQQRHK